MSEIGESFASSLSELTVNSKPHINMLTMLAEDHLDHASIITETVLTHLQKVPPEIKLPVLYLIDSIVKNVGKAYINLFTQNIVQCFTATFEKVDEKTREQMFKLRQTWSDVFPAKIIYALDAKVHQIDPAWPLSAPPSTVHLNPKFFKPEILDSKSITPTVKQPELAHVESRSHHRKNKTYNPRNHNLTHSTRSKKPSPTSTSSGSAVDSSAAPVVPTKPLPSPEQLREQMIMKQKMLLEVQQQKLKLELLQTQAQLEEQQKQHSVNSKTSQELSKLQQLLKQEEEKLKLMSKNLKKHTQKFPNRQQIVRVTSDMKAQKVTDLSKVTSVPESLVKPAALLELSNDEKPKAQAKSASRSRVAHQPTVPTPVTDKQKVITPADSTDDIVPPVRIAPVSSQLINAALSFGRNVRDPRIRQMSSRLESQLNTPAPTTTPTHTLPTQGPLPIIVPPRKQDTAPAHDSKSYDKIRKEKKSSNHHREKPSKHQVEENRSQSRSNSRSSDRSSDRVSDKLSDRSSRSKERDKVKSSPKKSEDKISSSRRAKIEELFSNSRPKSPVQVKPASSSTLHSPSKSYLNRDHSSRSDNSESVPKASHSERTSKAESSPKRIKSQEVLPETSTTDMSNLELLKGNQKLNVDITKIQAVKQSEISIPSISPEPMDSSAEMLDEDIEKIVRHPGFNRLKHSENKLDNLEVEKTDSQESLKSSNDSIEDKFDEIVRHPNKQLKLDKTRIIEENVKPKSTTFDSPVNEKSDKTELRKEVLNVNVSTLPFPNEKSSEEEWLTEMVSLEQPLNPKAPVIVISRHSEIPSDTTLINDRDLQKDVKTAEPSDIKIALEDNINQDHTSKPKPVENDNVPSSTVNSLSSFKHDIHKEEYSFFFQEEVVFTENTAAEVDEYIPMDSEENVEMQQLTPEQLVRESKISNQITVETSSNSEPVESIPSFKPVEKLTLSPKKVMSPIRNVEPMETIAEAHENIPSIGEFSSPQKSERQLDSSPVLQEKKVRKSDKPSLMEQVIVDAEKHEASPSPPPPPVISDKFKEIKQSSLIRLRRVGRSREDLTGQESPEPADVDLRTQIPPPPPTSSLTKDLKNEVLGLAEKDVDLRNLPASPTKKRPSMEKLLDIPPAKKSKAEVMDELFGSEDVDLRPVLCPPPPSPPPPPIISTSPPPEAAGERLWARYKQNKPDTYKVKYTPSRRDRAPSVDKFGRYNRLNSGSDVRFSSGGRVRSTEDVDMRAPPLTTDGSYNHIIIQAMEQHKRGDLDNDAYKRVLSEVFAMREKQQLEEAQRRDEEQQAEQLEPISDDDISGGSLSGVEDAPSPPESYSGGEDIDESCLKKSKSEDKQKPVDEHDGKAGENMKDVDIRVPLADVDIRFKSHHSRYDKDVKSVDEKSSRKTRGVSPYSRRSEESDKEKYRRRRDELRAQRREKKAKRIEEERSSRYRQSSQYGQEAWVPPPEHSESEDMEVDAVPRVPPLPPYLQPPPHDSPSQAPSVRPPQWEPPQRMPAPAPGPGPGPAPWMPGMPPVIRGPPAMGIRPPQDRFMPPRWHQPGPGPIFEGEPGPGQRFNRFGPPPMGRFMPPLGPCEVPPTDQTVLKAIDEDPTRSINIDGIPRDIRFYGITAVALMSWDDPREISFQPGSRHVIIDERDSVVVHFGGLPVEMIIDGQPRRIRFGAPTRELFIDNQWFEVFFGGPPVACNIAGQPHMVQLEGPPPPVKPGVPRRDLVLGKITLIIDAEYFFTIYLDAKPQKFEVKGVGYIIRFVEALQKTVINGVPFKSDFGGLPRPIILNGNKHFFRLTALPRGVTPGFLSIANMEGGRLPSPPSLPAPPQLPASLEQAVLLPPIVTAPPRLSPEVRDRDRDVEPGTLHAPALPSTIIPASSAPLVTTQPPASISVMAPTITNPLDMLTTLLPASEQGRNHVDYSYSVDNDNSQPEVQELTSTSAAPAGGAQTGAGEINVTELLQKLMATGIVPSLETPKEKGQDKPPTTDSTLIKPVDFRKPETLKTRQTMLISHLYSGIQCNSCGVRFPPEQTMKYSQHLDWHFRQNRRDKDSSRTAQTRRYYYDVSDWIQFEEIEDLEERAQPWFEMQEGAGEEEEPERVVVSVRAADYPDDAACHICHDKFESFYNEEKEEWHLRNASDHEGNLVHPLCLEDQRAAAEKPIVVDDIDITEDEPKEEESKKEEEADEKKEEPPKEEEDDDIMEVTDIEYIKPVFPVEDLTVSDTEDNEEKEVSKEEADELKEEKKKEEDVTEVTSTTNEEGETTKDETKTNEEDEEMPEDAAEKTEPEKTEEEVRVDEDTQDDILLMDKGEDSIISNAEIMEVVRNIKKDPDALGGEYEETGPDIKKEKGEVPLPAPVVDTTHATVTCLIDGNVEFEEPAQIAATGPPRIKINISKAIQSAPKEKEVKESDAIETPSDNTNPITHTMKLINSQPPPPGEEQQPSSVKERIKNSKMVEYPRIIKGHELSGLCSIM